MAKHLEVAYLATSPWCSRLLVALQGNSKLQAKHKVWGTHRLSDLAFAIQGRLAGVHQLIRFIDEQLDALGRTLEADPKLPEIIAGKYAYVFSGSDEIAVQRVLVGSVSFIREARSCFENLADFRSEFLAHYLGRQIEEKNAQYDALNRILRNPRWTDDLRRLRHDLSHYRYPWLAFKVMKLHPPRYEPILILNWRPGSTERVPFHTLRRIRSGLDSGVRRFVEALRKRVA